MLSTSQVGGLSFTEKSFHVVRASVAQCVCVVSSGQRTEGRSVLFLPSAFSGATFALRHASSFSWLYGLQCELLHPKTTNLSCCLLVYGSAGLVTMLCHITTISKLPRL